MAQIDRRQETRERVLAKANVVRQSAESDKQSYVSAERRRVRETTDAFGEFAIEKSTNECK